MSRRGIDMRLGDESLTLRCSRYSTRTELMGEVTGPGIRERNGQCRYRISPWLLYRKLNVMRTVD